MFSMEVVGDSQENEMLIALAAAMGTQANPGSALRPQAAGRLAGEEEGEDQAAAEVAAQAAGAAASLPAAAGVPAAAHPPLTAAARVFGVLCTEAEVEPHPQLVRILTDLPREAYAPLDPWKRPGKGGAVIQLPSDALPHHLDALLKLQSADPSLISLEGDGADVGAAPCFLRAVHLDLSGHMLASTQLKQVLVDAAWRLRNCFVLESLVLERCQLAPDALGVLLDSKALEGLRNLQRLVLAGNPLLGTRPQHAQQGSTPVAWLAGAAVQGEAACVGPEDVWQFESVFREGQLRLLDLKGVGFGDGAYACMLYLLTTYPAPTGGAAAAAAREVGPAAPEHDGCRSTLECLKLGPPADREQFSEGTVECIVQVLRSAPRLQAVEVVGVSPDAVASLLVAWQEVTEQRYGHRGCTAAVSGSSGRRDAVRLVLSADAGQVAAEHLPTDHVPLQPPTPEPCLQPPEPAPLSYAAVDAPGTAHPSGHRPLGPTRPSAQPVQQRLTSYVTVAAAPSAGQPSGSMQDRQAPLRAPGAGSHPRQHALPRHPTAGGGSRQQRAAPGGGHAAGRASGTSSQYHSGQYHSGSSAPSAAAAAAAGAGFGRFEQQGARFGASADPLAAKRGRGGEGGDGNGNGGGAGNGGAGRPPKQQRRRQGGGGGRRGGGGDRLYRGGAAEDVLPQYGEVDLDDMAEDDQGSQGEEGEDGSEESGHVEGIHSDGEKIPSDQASKNYEAEMKGLIRRLTRQSAAAGKKLRKKWGVWQLAAYPTDRRRWSNPDKTIDDNILQLDALASMHEILVAHDMERWRYMKWVPQWVFDRVRQYREQEEEKRQQAEEGEEEEEERQQQGHGRRKLRRAVDWEQEELEDRAAGGAADSDAELRTAGGGSATQRQIKRKLVIDSDEEEEDAEEGEEEEGMEEDTATSGSGSGSGSEEQPLAARHRRQRLRLQASGLTGEGTSSPSGTSPEAQQQQQQQQLAQTPWDSDIDSSSDDEPVFVSEMPAPPQPLPGKHDARAADVAGAPMAAAAPRPTAGRQAAATAAMPWPDVAAAAAAEAEAAVAAAVQQMQLCRQQGQAAAGAGGGRPPHQEGAAMPPPDAHHAQQGQAQQQQGQAQQQQGQAQQQQGQAQQQQQQEAELEGDGDGEEFEQGDLETCVSDSVGSDAYI